MHAGNRLATAKGIDRFDKELIREYLETAEIVAKLPNSDGAQCGADVPYGLSGAKIVAVGTVAEFDLVPGGGLVIDYIPQGSERVCRAVLEFDDRGMQTYFQRFR